MTYSNVNNFIVILADDRDPDVSFRHHRERGSYGGVDCVASLGTPIYAPDDCILVNYPDNESGGNTIQLRYLNGAVDEMMHLSQFVESGSKAKGALVGYSGDTGSPGQPHVHWHRLGDWRTDEYGKTNRYNPFHYFETSPAKKVMHDMFLIRNVDGTISLVTSKGRAPIPNIQHVQLIQRMFNSFPNYDTFNAREIDLIMSYIYSAK